VGQLRGLAVRLVSGAREKLQQTAHFGAFRGPVCVARF
jgi:hypothetical protein